MILPPTLFGWFQASFLAIDNPLFPLGIPLLPVLCCQSTEWADLVFSQLLALLSALENPAVSAAVEGSYPSHGFSSSSSFS
jgi:hypothetical protein